MTWGKGIDPFDNPVAILATYLYLEGARQA